MGIVYRAWHPELEREVALKVLPRGATEDLEQRFRREAKLAARLRHPHIVAVHDVGAADGLLYLAMDLIEGESLHEVINDRLIDPREAADLACKVAAGVAHAHAEGVLHRDIKPGNVLVDRAGTPFLADFGLARAVDTEGSEKLSRSGSIIGTPAYMSPEQAQGGDIDQRADVWACGVMLFEMVTSAVPFSGGTAVQVMSNVVGKDPPPMRRFVKSTPRDLEAIVHRCLEKDIERRYPDATALVADLQRFLDGRPVEARRVTVWLRARSWVRRNRAVTLTAVAGAGAVAAVLLYVSLLGPWWRDAARTSRLAQITDMARTLVHREEAALADRLAELTSASSSGRPSDGAALQQVATDAGRAAVLARVAAALPPSLRPGVEDSAAAEAFAAGVAGYASAEVQAGVAMARGDHALAYRLDPVGPTGLAAAVQLADQLAGERRLGEAAGLLVRIHARYPNAEAGRLAAAELARVELMRGHWTAALRADAAAGDASSLPPLARTVLERLGKREQQLPVPTATLDDAGLPRLRQTPEQVRLLDMGARGRWIVLPQRLGGPIFVVADDGTLAPAGLVTDHLPSGWSVIDVAAGDADGDGRAEGIVQFTYEGGGPWLIEWSPKFGELTHRVAATSVSGRGDLDGGCIADLDGDGTVEMVLGTSLHTTARAVVCRWTSLGGLLESYAFDLGHPGACVVLPKPGAPGKFMLGMMAEVGLPDHARARSPHRARLIEGEDTVRFYEWTGAGLTPLGRRTLSDGDPDRTFPGSISGGMLGGRPVVQWWVRRTARGPNAVAPVGTQLWFSRGIPSEENDEVVALAPPRRCTDARLVDLTATPNDEPRLLLVTPDTIEVWGPRSAPVQPLTPAKLNTGGGGEAAARMDAARDLLLSGRADAAIALLEETAARFPGTDEAVEADRLRIDALLRRAHGERGDADALLMRGARPAAAVGVRWRATATEALTAADVAAVRYRRAPARMRRFRQQGVEAAILLEDWAAASRLQDQVVAAASGRDDQRHADRRRAALSYLRDLHADTNGAQVRFGDPELPLIADDPLRLRLAKDGTLHVPLDSHHTPGVVGVPVRWSGRGVRLEADLSLDGSAWAGNFYVGLVPRDPPDAYPGLTSVRVLTWELGGWDGMPQRFRMEGAHGIMEARPLGFRGRWKVRWDYLPEIGESRLEVRDHATGAVVYRGRRETQRPLGPGRYVLGIGFKTFSGDAYWASAAHPLVVDVTLHALTLRHGPNALTLDRKAPVGAVAAAQVAGGALLRGDLETAGPLYATALARDPGNARAALYGALAGMGRPSGASAVGRLRDLIHARPLAAMVALDDLGRVAEAAVRRRLGQLIRSILQVIPDDFAHELDRAICLAMLGDYTAARPLVFRAVDGPARRYLQARLGLRDTAWKRDMDWLRSRGAVLPGSELPVVCWAPGEGETPAVVRAAAAEAHAALQRQRTWGAALQAWVAWQRWHLLEPQAGPPLKGAGDVAMMVGQQGVAERWWRRRAAVLADDAGAAVLLVQLYLNRSASREVCDALQQAADRGGAWSDLPSELQSKLDQWFAAGGESHAGRFDVLRAALGADPK